MTIMMIKQIVHWSTSPFKSMAIIMLLFFSLSLSLSLYNVDNDDDCDLDDGDCDGDEHQPRLRRPLESKQLAPEN